MLVNISKNEPYLFEEKQSEAKTIKVNEENIGTSQKIKILGLNFSSDFSWYNHEQKASDIANKHGLAGLRRLSPKHLL